MDASPPGRADRGQSAVIGFVLMFGLLILLMGVLQVSAVPAWNQGEEFAHSQQVRSELELLRDDVTTAAATGRVTSESLTLGLRYPRRPFLLNPADPTGRLNTTTTGTVELENLSASGETGDYWAGGTRQFDTRHVVYRPQYNEYDNAPTTVLENSVLYDRYGDRTLPLTSERVVSGRRITLVMLAGSVSRSATTATDIELTPVSAPEQVTSVEADGPVRLRLPTQLDEAAWRDLLRDEFVRNGGHVYDNVSVRSGTPYDTVTITLEGEETYDLRMAEVAIGEQSSQATAHYLTTEESSLTSLSPGSSQRVVFEVRDRYNNPVSGVRVNATLGGKGTVSPVDPVTDRRGHATFRYTGSDPGTVWLNATFGDSPGPLETATVRLDVVGGATPGDGGADGAGPVVTSIDTSETTASGQSVSQGETVTLTATATEFGYGGLDIHSVEWHSNRTTAGGGPDTWFAFQPTDGEFDSVNETVTTDVDTSGWATGPHEVTVRARDSNGNVGPARPYTIVVTAGSTDPPGALAYDDANQNGRYDSGETTYDRSRLEGGLDDDSVNLVVPSDVGTLDLRGELVTRSMVIRTEIDTRGREVKLTARGSIDIAGTTVSTRGKKIELTAGEDGPGELIATGATLDTNRDIELQSNGDMDLDGATISAGRGADIEADLGIESATLSVDGATIQDSDDTIEYEPEDATVLGSPASGDVESD